MASDQAIRDIVAQLVSAQQPQTAPMMGAIAAPQPMEAPTFLGMLPAPGDRSGGAIREINPGAGWDGHDVNTMLPDIFMTDKMYAKPLRQEDL